MQPAGGDCKNVWRGAAGIRCENGDRSNLMYPASTESNSGVKLGISVVHKLKTGDKKEYLRFLTQEEKNDASLLSSVFQSILLRVSVSGVATSAIARTLCQRTQVVAQISELVQI